MCGACRNTRRDAARPVTSDRSRAATIIPIDAAPADDGRRCTQRSEKIYPRAVQRLVRRAGAGPACG